MVNIMKNKIKYLSVGILTLTTASGGVAFLGAPVLAETSGSKPATVTVANACSFFSSTSISSSLSLSAGSTANTESDSSRVTNTVVCNSPNGFSVQAVGFSPDATHPDGLEGNTAMYGTNGTIATGISGDNSYWSFKVSNVSSSTNSAAIAGDYDEYSVIPDSPVTIAQYAAAASGVSGGTFRTDYQVHIGGSQAAGSYSGVVKYTLAVAP